MNKRQYIALACLLAFAANAGAQTEYADSVQMEEFVVTGTRTLKVLAETPIQTRLISAKDIKESDATNISDLLQQEIPERDMIRDTRIAYSSQKDRIIF